MKTDPTVIARIRELLTRHPHCGILPHLADDDLDNLAGAAAAESFRVAQARWMQVSCLAWNIENLRPALLKRLEDELVTTALSRCKSQGITPPTTTEAESTPESHEAAPSLPPLPEPAEPEKKTESEAPVSPSAMVRRPPYREDWFDRFLTFFTNLIR